MSNKCLVLFAVITVALCQDSGTQPLYKYRYQTEDVMKTAATSIPVRGYHVAEGGYYPQVAAGAGGIGLAGGAGGYGGGVGLGGAGLGYGAGVGGGAGLGYGGLGYGAGLGYGGAGLRSISTVGGGIGGAGLGYGGGIGGGAGLGYGGAGIGGAGLGYGGGGLGLKAIGPVGAGIGGAGLGYGGGIGGAGIGGGIGGAGIGGGAGLVGTQLFYPGYGGEYVDKNIYSGGKKNLNDEKFEKASGKKGEEFGAGNEGYAKGIAAVKDAKGESGYYNDQSGGKKAIEDGKFYSGGQHFNQQGKNGGELNEKSGHKKGHVIKGYKSSHHKDETGKTEEYYDEANDEGGKVNYNGQSGSFGKLGATSYKGGHENDEFAAGGQKKQGHFDNQHILDNSNANQGNYGQKKYGGSGAVYGVNNGIDEQSLLGHQENSRFYKHHPHHVPFY